MTEIDQDQPVSLRGLLAGGGDVAAPDGAQGRTGRARKGRKPGHEPSHPTPQQHKGIAAAEDPADTPAPAAAAPAAPVEPVAPAAAAASAEPLPAPVVADPAPVTPLPEAGRAARGEPATAPHEPTGRPPVPAPAPAPVLPAAVSEPVPVPEAPAARRGLSLRGRRGQPHGDVVQRRGPLIPPLVDRVRDAVFRSRITGELPGHQRIAVVSLKGGSGRTTLALGLGDVLAVERREPVAVLDAVPVHGTVASRAGDRTGTNIMGVLANHQTYAPYGAPGPTLFRRASGLAVLPSERNSDARYVLGGDGYRWVAENLMPRHYSVTVTDSPTGLSDALMASVLSLANQLVLTTTSSPESASLALDALVWLNRHGYRMVARRAVLAVNAVRPGDPGVPVTVLRDYFGDKVGAVVEVPWDRHLAAGQPIDTARLAPDTRTAFLHLAAAAMAPLTTRKSK